MLRVSHKHFTSSLFYKEEPRPEYDPKKNNNNIPPAASPPMDPIIQRGILPVSLIFLYI